MPQIRFTQSVKIPRDKIEEWGNYVNGSVHSVTNDEAERWLRRGVAEIVESGMVKEVVEQKPESEPEPEPVAQVEVIPEEVKEEEVVSEEKVEDIAEGVSPTVTSIRSTRSR